MKLAYGDRQYRHYVVHTVLGRHFVQTGRTCGLPDKTVRGIIEDLADTAGAKIDAALASLVKDFPQALAHSIAADAKRRLDGIATMKGGA